MDTIYGVCPTHGRVPLDHLIGGGGTATFVNSEASCPYRGRTAKIPSGTYRIGDALMDAVRSREVSRDDVVAFRQIAQAVKNGNTNAEEAAAQAAEINSLFGHLLKWANENGVALGLLIGILALVVTCYSIISANQGSAEAHADAQALLKAQQSVAQSDQNAQQALKKLDKEIERLNVLAGRQAEQSRSSLQSLRPDPPQMQGLVTRQQRRRAAQLAKKRARGRP